MKQYIYPPIAIGLNEWPSGTLRLEGIDITDNPDAADIFTVPGALVAHFPNRDALYRLPHFRGREDKHAFFDCTDNEPLYDLPCLFIRCNTRTWYLSRDPNTIAWCWPVEDFQDCINLPINGFRYDVSFQGWLSYKTRESAVRACKRKPQLKCDIATYTDFYGYIWNTPEGKRRRGEFIRSMKESRLALCPESIPGVFPYRFFEAMSAARVPVLVGSDFVFPMADEIPYKSFALIISREYAASVDQLILEFLQSHTDEALIEMGKMARHYWDTSLHRDKWPQLMSYAVQKKLQARACASP